MYTLYNIYKFIKTIHLESKINKSSLLAKEKDM